MTNFPEADPKSVINSTPAPPSGNRSNNANNRVPPENRNAYSTPNFSANTTPDPPQSMTSYPMKPKPPGTA